MTAIPSIIPSASGTFADDEPVLTSHALLPGAVSPRFGNSEQWAFDGVLRKPANLHASGWKLMFTRFEGPWRLRARELAMIALNPQHPKVLASAVPAGRRPSDPRTVIMTLNAARHLIEWAVGRGIGSEPADWSAHHMHAYLAHIKQRISADTALTHVKAIRELHRCAPLLTGGGLAADPWAGMSSRAAAGVTWTKANRTVATRAIPPEVWFPLIRASWAYVDTFAPDIIEAMAVHHDLQRRAAAGEPADALEVVLRRFLAAGNPVPLFHALSPSVKYVGGVHWSLLALQLGYAYGSGRSRGLQQREGTRRLVQDAVAAGQCVPASVLPELVRVPRADGVDGPWHPGLDARSLYAEIRAARVAAFVFVSALSMMRDSEVHEITRGSVVEHFGSPAVVSALVKGQEDFPAKHWWIIEPVARAIAVAEDLSPHPERLFTGVRSRTNPEETFAAAERMTAFVAHVNRMTGFTGLDPIPDGRISPHMFRRTMAMLTDSFPGSEIALGIQLKHVAARALANRNTAGYASHDPSWAEHLDTAVEAARFLGLRELFEAHKAGEPIGHGPGAEQLARTFDKIRETVAAEAGDAVVEEAMLRKARISIRFGTLNNCLFDPANPHGALCLENAIVPPGHAGPLPDRCRPERCGNSMLGITHIPIWDSEARALDGLLQVPHLPPARRAALEQQRDDVRLMLRKAGR